MSGLPLKATLFAAPIDNYVGSHTCVVVFAGRGTQGDLDGHAQLFLRAMQRGFERVSVLVRSGHVRPLAADEPEHVHESLWWVDGNRRVAQKVERSERYRALVMTEGRAWEREPGHSLAVAYSIAVLSPVDRLSSPPYHEEMTSRMTEGWLDIYRVRLDKPDQKSSLPWHKCWYPRAFDRVVEDIWGENAENKSHL